MSSGLKLLFDECCSPRLPRELRDFYQRDYPNLQIQHLMDHWTPGTPDSEWLETLRLDLSWIVITKDAGKNSAQEKLPLICREWGITHIVFTPGIISKGFITQKNAIAGVWEQLFHLHRLPPGTQVKLGESSQKGDVTGFELRVIQKSLATVLRNLQASD
jgi:PIN like domain